ncbi:diadenosine tetraphosphate (Ap4A) HIT family hydrolase [Paenibacillus sp. LBL]|uniref:HIT family protein n=1 Tax=Paenibacillus sp. LBL TaxID=2940563 RepID=UPI0024730126|nr:HIT domain-containing protein [Paenibacillus sp. LBL]MDH6674554.1 diadenosine tetraphosphate (Ap4A) HIT family hydrolase [Paenibacillus sp. LBL]
MERVEKCLICEKHRLIDQDAFLYKSNYWFLYAGPFDSQVLGYIYLEPIRHVEEWQSFSADELEEMTIILPMLEKVLRKILKLERLYTVTISEAVRHLHIHLIPRYQNQEKKGLALIEQATQQKPDAIEFDRSSYYEFVNHLKREIAVEYSLVEGKSS